MLRSLLMLGLGFFMAGFGVGMAVMEHGAKPEPSAETLAKCQAMDAMKLLLNRIAAQQERIRVLEEEYGTVPVELAKAMQDAHWRDKVWYELWGWRGWYTRQGDVLVRWDAERGRCVFAFCQPRK